MRCRLGSRATSNCRCDIFRNKKVIRKVFVALRSDQTQLALAPSLIALTSKVVTICSTADLTSFSEMVQWGVSFSKFIVSIQKSSHSLRKSSMSPQIACCLVESLVDSVCSPDTECSPQKRHAYRSGALMELLTRVSRSSTSLSKKNDDSRLHMLK